LEKAPSQELQDCRLLSCNAFELHNPFSEFPYSVASCNSKMDSRSYKDLFAAISLMKNFVRLEIRNTSITEIPDNAFTPSNERKNFFDIVISNTELNRIGNNPFHNLPQLLNIFLINNKLNRIPKGVFNFPKVNGSLYTNIYLTNNHLNSSSFEIGAFSNLKRPTIIQLENYGSSDTNKITYLNQKVFQPFHDSHEKNRVNIGGLDCADCRNYWLVENSNYSNQLFGISCSNFAKITDMTKNFKGCNSHK